MGFNVSNQQARFLTTSSVNTFIAVTFGVTNVVAKNSPQSISTASTFIWLQLKELNSKVSTTNIFFCFK